MKGLEPFPRRSKKAVLSDDQVANVLLNCHVPADDAQFARRFGVFPTTIGRVRRRETYHEARRVLRERGVLPSLE